jgi:acyl transferase domain-containing protein
MTRAFVFPGQGAQTIGMGQALAAAYPSAKAVFQEVDGNIYGGDGRVKGRGRGRVDGGFRGGA